VNKEFPVKGIGGLAMPAYGAKGMLEIPIECLDVPSHVIELGEFRSGVNIRV